MFSRHYLEKAKKGENIFLLLENDCGEFTIENEIYKIEPNPGLTFLARSKEEVYTKSFGAKDFSFFYNKNTDFIDFISETYVSGKNITPLLFSYQKPDFADFAYGVKELLPSAGYVMVGKGKIFLLTLNLAGRVGYNPVLDNFLLGLLK